MAWNGSDSKKVEGKRPEAKRRKGGIRPSVSASNFNYKALVAGAIVVLGGAAAWWLLTGEGGESDGTEDHGAKAGRIAEVEPQIVTDKSAEESPEESLKEKIPSRPDPNARPTELGQVLNGYVMTGSGLHKIYGEITNTCSIKADYEIFNHSAENTIACLLALKAGDNLVGDVSYDGAFRESLKRSLKDPIRIEDTDTPEQAELKQAVIEAKAELKKAMDRGEDVEQIVIDARRECQELARAKQMMMSDVYEFVDKDAVTSDDVEIYVEAANKLLESKGIAPIDRSTLVDIKLRHKLDDYDPDTDEELNAEENETEDNK